MIDNSLAARSPVSAIAGIGWPALPGREHAATLAILFQLEQTQWWSLDRLLAFQRRQAQLLIAHAQATVPFYRDRLAEAAAVPAGRMGERRWHQIPIIRRADIQAAGTAALSAAPPKSHGAVGRSTTSGSTGHPLAVYRTQIENLFHRALTLRYHLWHRRDLTADTVAIRTLPQTMCSGQAVQWAPGFRTGPQYMLDISRPIPELLDAVLAVDPVYLQTHPSALDGLLRLSHEAGRKPARLREARTFGEVLTPALRQRCENVWGVAVTENYTTEEFGIVALQCPDHQHLHVQAENVLVEVLGDDDRPCRPGEVGRVVVTALHNFAMPLIRYDIGDLAAVGPPCLCGRQLPVLSQVLGRTRHLVTLPDGSQRLPVFDEDRIAAAAPITQFRAVQTAVGTVELHLATRRQLTMQEEAAVKACFDECLGAKFLYKLTYYNEFPRSQNGKFEIFRTELQSRYE